MAGPNTVVDAMAVSAGLTDKGFTFVGEGGPERFVPFRDVHAAARRAAGLFLTLGLNPGERIAVIVPGQQPFITAFLGALIARLVPVPCYPPSAIEKVATWRAATLGILRTASPAVIVTTEELRPLLWALAVDVDATIVTVGQLRAGPEDALPTGAADPDDTAFLQFTSGSTDAPRGVMVTHRNILENCERMWRGLLRPDVEENGVSWLPLYHDMGLLGFVLLPLLFGRSVVHVDTFAFLKRPSVWFSLIDRHRATITFAPPFAYALAVRRIAAAELATWDLSCLRVAGCGAESISPRTLRSFAEHFAPAGLRPEALCPCYGLAEATLLVTRTAPGERWRSDVIDADRLVRDGEARPAHDRTGAVEVVGAGTAVTGHTVRILDDRGRLLPERHVGEVEVRGPSITAGYHADTEATRRTYRDGGLRTGDLGYLAGGQLFLTGRQKDVVIVHGRNYPPERIEWSLTGLPVLRAGNAVAFGCPGAGDGDDLVVVCEAADPAGVADAVRDRVAGELGLIVQDVLVLPPGGLPKTSSGKPQRTRTRSMYADGTLRRMAESGRPTRFARRLLLARLRWAGVLSSVRYRIRRTRRRDTAAVPR